MDKKSMGMITYGALSVMENIARAVREKLAVSDGLKLKFNRGNNYLSPADFYNHRSRTFLQNKRKGL